MTDQERQLIVDEVYQLVKDKIYEHNTVDLDAVNRIATLFIEQKIDTDIKAEIVERLETNIYNRILERINNIIQELQNGRNQPETGEGDTGNGGAGGAE